METGEPDPIHSPWRPSTAALPMTASGTALRRVACRRDLFQQRSRARDPGTQRTHPSTQRRVGGVNQGRLPDPEGRRAAPRCDHQRHHGGYARWCTTTRPCGRRRHAGRGGTVEDNGPCAFAAEHVWGNLGDKPLRSLSAVSPPAVRTRAHHVVAVHEHGGLHGLVHRCSGLRSSGLGREIIAVSGSHYLRL